MNYLVQLNAFYARVLAGALPPRAQLLYHTLLAENNRCRWREWFSRSSAALCGVMRIGERTLIQARGELVERGLLECRLVRGAMQYRIVPLDRDGAAAPVLPAALPDALPSESAPFPLKKEKRKQDKPPRGTRGGGCAGLNKKKGTPGVHNFRSEGGPSYDLDAWERQSLWDTLPKDGPGPAGARPHAARPPESAPAAGKGASAQPCAPARRPG